MISIDDKQLCDVKIIGNKLEEVQHLNFKDVK